MKDRLGGRLLHHSAAVKNRRAHEAKAVSEETGRTFRAASIGETLSVLFETGDGNGSLGHSDTYLLTRVPESGLHGQLRPVRILAAEKDGSLTGELV